MKNLDGTGLKRLHRDWRRQTTKRMSVILDTVQTPYNVGSILRSGAAYRIDHLWVAGNSESPRHPKTQKTALGSDRFVEWTITESTDQAIGEAERAGYTVVGVELADQAVPIFSADLSGDVCLVVGHEDRGLSAIALARCAQIVYLPQLGKVGSLNVAQATSIAMYETRRQQWNQLPDLTSGAMTEDNASE